MASIYELSRDYQELSLMIETAETEEELQAINDTLDAISGALDVKLENSAKFIKNLDADQKLLFNLSCPALQRYIKAAIENEVNVIKTSLDGYLLLAGTQR